VLIGILDPLDHSKGALAVDLLAEGNHPKKFGDLREILLIRYLRKDFQPECGFGLALVEFTEGLFKLLVHSSPPSTQEYSSSFRPTE
jgi:hypothetical protein